MPTFRTVIAGLAITTACTGGAMGLSGLSAAAGASVIPASAGWDSDAFEASMWGECGHCGEGDTNTDISDNTVTSVHDNVVDIDYENDEDSWYHD